MNGETLPRIVGVSIIKVALIEKLAIYVVWCITTPNNCTCVLQQYEGGGGGVDYFKVMTNNT